MQPAGPEIRGAIPGVMPISSTPLADRLVRPYRTGPWAAGTLTTAAFGWIPMFSAIAAVALGEALGAGGLASSPDKANAFYGGLFLAGLPAIYLAIASLINVARFASLRNSVTAHYGAVGKIAGRDPHTDHAIAGALRADHELHELDRRRHVLRAIGVVFSFVLAVASMFSGDSPGGGNDFDVRNPRAGQFGYKMFWGILLIGGGAIGIFLGLRSNPHLAVVVATYVGLNLLWWLPSLWRSRTLRSVEHAWQDGAASVYARLPMSAPQWCERAR